MQHIKYSHIPKVTDYLFQQEHTYSGLEGPSASPFFRPTRVLATSAGNVALDKKSILSVYNGAEPK